MMLRRSPAITSPSGDSTISRGWGRWSEKRGGINGDVAIRTAQTDLQLFAFPLHAAKLGIVGFLPRHEKSASGSHLPDHAGPRKINPPPRNPTDFGDGLG